MPAPFLIIDGYNLMHAAGMARQRYGPGGLERCRTRFLRFLARRLTTAERRRTTIVFDAGDAPPDGRRRYALDEMTVLFAQGSDADTLIEELIAGHSAPRQIRVVSSDHRLQRAARRRRGEFVGSERFCSHLERRGPVDDQLADGDVPGAHAKFTGRVPARETQEWLDEFGEADVRDSDLNTEAQRLQDWLDALPEDPDDWPPLADRPT